MMPQNLSLVYIRVTLTFDLLDPSRCDTVGIYRDMRLPRYVWFKFINSLDCLVQ